MSKDLKTELDRLINICNELGRLPTDKEMKTYKFVTNILNKYSKEEGFNNWHEYCFNYGFISKKYVSFNGKIKECKLLNFEDIVLLFKEYYKIHNEFPKSKDMTSSNNLPSHITINNILKKSNKELRDLRFLIIDDMSNLNNKGSRWIKDKYNDYIQEYKTISNELGDYIPEKDLSIYHLPSSKWFISNCPTKIKSYSEFVEYCGFIPKLFITKDKAIELILQLQNKMDRVLISNDFKDYKNNKIGMGTIIHYWGSLNNMKKELNLPIYKENVVSKPIDELKLDIIKVCKYVELNENRRIVTYNDINAFENCLNAKTYNERFKKELNISLRQFIKDIGFELAYNGLIFYFDDGERVRSLLEKKFSEFLRYALKLKYNVDYQRDIKYKTFINDCNNKMDCDYVIHYNNRIIYIEIVGILKDSQKKFFINNIPIINSKTKETYRQHLIKKELMLKNNNLEYYILFPSDLEQEDFLMQIFNKED